LAILVGLLTADKTPTQLAWIVAVLASLTAGTVTFIQARGSNRESSRLRRELVALRQRVTTPTIELIEPSEGAGTQGPEMRIRGRVHLEGCPDQIAVSILDDRKLEVVPFVRPIITPHSPSAKWWSQNVATISEVTGEISGTVRIGSLKSGVGEQFKVVLLILPHGFIPRTDTRYDDLPGVAVAFSNVRTVYRLGG
jgi:hypothetical protein